MGKRARGPSPHGAVSNSKSAARKYRENRSPCLSKACFPICQIQRPDISSKLPLMWAHRRNGMKQTGMFNAANVLWVWCRTVRWLICKFWWLTLLGFSLKIFCNNGLNQCLHRCKMTPWKNVHSLQLKNYLSKTIVVPEHVYLMKDFVLSH